MIFDPHNPLHLIPAVLASNPDLIVVLPVFHPMAPDHSLVLSAKRRLRRLPPELAAQMAQQEAQNRGNGSGPITPPTHIEVGRLLLTVPADVAENLRGPAEERHPVFLFTVHRSAYDEAVRQSESRIVMPGVEMRVNAGKLVKP